MDAKPLPKFDVDGLPYDASFLQSDMNSVFPIAFSGEVQMSYDKEPFAEFVSDRGVRTLALRGRAPRTWSVSFELPWDYAVIPQNLVVNQEHPFYFTSAFARRNNVAPPYGEMNDVFVGSAAKNAPLAVNYEDFQESGMRAWGPTSLRTFTRYDPKMIYGPEFFAVLGATMRFRGWIEGGQAAIVGLDGNGNEVWKSPTISGGNALTEGVSDPFVIPRDKGIAALRDWYSTDVRSFAPTQIWYGAHLPPIAERMGGWVRMSGFQRSEKPRGANPLCSVSFSLKEVG